MMTNITGGLIAEREHPGLASTMWGTLNLDGAPHQMVTGIHHPWDKALHNQNSRANHSSFRCMYVREHQARLPVDPRAIFKYPFSEKVTLR